MRKLKLFSTYWLKIWPIKYDAQHGYLTKVQCINESKVIAENHFDAPVTNLQMREHFLNLLINNKN